MTPPESDGPAASRPPLLRGQGPALAAVALGGALGALARYALALGLPTPTGGFPWATFWANVLGCAVIGAFTVAVTEARTVHPLTRPFLGTGVLGGFTTFSTYAVDVRALMDAGRPGTAFACLAGTLLAALAAVWLTATLTRRLLKGRSA
jgi:CrcB protein